MHKTGNSLAYLLSQNQKPTARYVQMVSKRPTKLGIHWLISSPISNNAGANRHVCFAPKSGHVRCKDECPLRAISGHRLAYSITSSAATRRPGGMLMPSAFAVLRLRSVSNLVGA